jgi:hypothetical protein
MTRELKTRQSRAPGWIGKRKLVPSARQHSGTTNPQELQRRLGNRGTEAWMRIQTQLTVGQPGDRYEQEANRIADDVISQETPKEEVVRVGIQTRLSMSATRGEQDISEHLENRLNRSSRTGSPIPPSTQFFFEPRMQHDFSDVRIHTDKEADQMNRVLRAQAFTQGQDIYFGNGQYNPQSRTGLRLLAHELTHVVQQTGTGRSLHQPAGIAQPNEPGHTINTAFPGALQTSVLMSTLSAPLLQRFGETRSYANTSMDHGSEPLWRNRNTFTVRAVQDAARVLWNSDNPVDHQTAQNLYEGHPPVYFRNELTTRVSENQPDSYWLPDRTPRVGLYLGDVPSAARGVVLWGDQRPYIIIYPNRLEGSPMELENLLVHEMNHATRGRSLEETDIERAAAPPIRGVDASWPHWTELVQYKREFDAYWVQPSFRLYTPESHRAQMVREHILARYGEIEEAYRADRRFRRLVHRYGRPRARRRRESARLSNVWPEGLEYPRPATPPAWTSTHCCSTP